MCTERVKKCSEELLAYGRWSGAEDRSVVEYFRLTSPIYPEDVQKIILRCYGTGEELEIWPGIDGLG